MGRHREYIRLAASALVRLGLSVERIPSLADIVAPDAFRAVLRHYHNKANGKPNSFVITLAQALIDVAHYQVKAPEPRIKELKTIAAKLPAVPFDLTEKNKELLRRLVFLPDELQRKAAADLRQGHLSFVAAQVAVAIDIQLIAPLRPQNLITLHWRRNFQETQGPNGPLVLFIPKQETKSRKRDLSFELPVNVADGIRWYRREILPRLNAPADGNLFVTGTGTAKHQQTLAAQIGRAIAEHVGVDMSPHQFRHLAAHVYLEGHPEDYQTVTDLLGHSWAKTTQIYAGLSGRRASRAYGNLVLQQRQALQLKRPARQRG